MQLSAIDLNQLAVLQALLETESVKAAARRVALSPSAVSHTLARLRVQLDDPLLVRAGQRLVPTPRAEAMRPRLAAALEAVARAVAPEGRFVPSEARRRFTLICTDHVELSVLDPLGARLLASAPGVDLHCVSPNRGTVDKLRSGGADLGVGVFRDLPGDFVAETLFEETFVTLLRRGHPALDQRWTAQRYAALGHVLVAPGGVPRGLLDDRLAELGLTRRIVRSVSTFLVAPFLVARTDLVVTLPSRVAAALASHLDLVVRAPPPKLATSFPVQMMWHRRDDEEAAHAWLRQEVRAAAGELPTRRR